MIEDTKVKNGDSSRNVKNITRAFEDAVAYPILTRDVTSGTSGDGSSGGAPSSTGQSPGSVAQNTLRQVLGWRFRTDDSKGFLAALKKTFDLKEVDGHVEWDYTPQSYSAQADMGEITGAQASIYARAKAALDQSLPLLDGLTQLRPDADVEDMEAMRSIVRSELNQLVGELGVVGGPRVQRVDSVFSLLIGPKADYGDPRRVKGHLGQLKDRFGMEDKYINTVQDEQDLTNFLILVDYVNSLHQTWEAQRRFFRRGAQGEPFLGNQLILLGQALDSLADSIQGSYDAMDSVYLGAPERQTSDLQFWDESPITLSELLGWVLDFATNEGKQLLQDAGKDGVVAFRSTINRLDYLMFLTVQVARSGSGGLVQAFYTFRVLRALQEVEKYLRLCNVEAEKIRRHAVEDPASLVAPSAELSLNTITIPIGAPPLNAVQLKISGSNIQRGAVVKLISTQHPNKGCNGVMDPSFMVVKPKIPGGVSSGTIISTFDLTAFDLPAVTTEALPFIVVVVNPDGQCAWKEKSLAFSTSSGLAKPIIESVAPATIKAGKIVSLTLRGKNFDLLANSPYTLAITTGGAALPVAGASVNVVSDTKITVSGLATTGWPPGEYSISLNDSYGNVYALDLAFQVTAK